MSHIAVILPIKYATDYISLIFHFTIYIEYIINNVELLSQKNALKLFHNKDSFY